MTFVLSTKYLVTQAQPVLLMEGLASSKSSEGESVSLGKDQVSANYVTWSRSLSSVDLCSQLKNEAVDKGDSMGPSDFSQTTLL